MDETAVVTCFLRNRGEVLLLHRSDEVGSYTGRWGAVAGHAEGDPDGAAREEIEEETGLDDAVSLVRAGDPFEVTDDDLDTRWIVHPYLFDCESREVEANDETTDIEWASPTEIRQRETVPDLWTSYERVAPTVETIETDTDHGSAWLSVRALEVLRDRAGVLATSAAGEDENGDWSDLETLAEDLRTARPSMTVVANRINRTMATSSDDRTPGVIERAATAGIDRAFEADEATVREAAARLDGTVLTLSRSGTVLDTLRQATVEEVLVCESRPAREGVGVAEALADDCPVTLAIDAAAAHLLAERAVDAVVAGADTVFADGSVLNKIGTRAVAVAAAHENVPVCVVAASDKIDPDPESEPEFGDGDRDQVYDGDADLAVANPTFDRTPAEHVTIVTEHGQLERDDIAETAAELRELTAWS
ncbi:NUDIX domain-containing protein [Halococcus saccharolyticus]|uniref:Initiation factor 2B related protein n=1 Tax=Halococcus saccharolyticus DSM 5350 TaxID=1227455 RepID=M0MIX6_9EURY|nr:NUDIX domain-containing protein [Halococcus saccharolyticus]EMA45308.1 initiation factor 2B related protein [Halococcus saccharolyticus DSM 5350]